MRRMLLSLEGELCPVPVARATELAGRCAPGTIIELRCTDPGVREDMAIWCDMHGHELLDVRDVGGTIVVEVRIGRYVLG